MKGVPRRFRYRNRRALSAVLINPDFLFRVESDPGKQRQTAFIESAIRTGIPTVVFPLSSVPDDELLNAAARGKLSRPEARKQARRMPPIDARSTRHEFAGQWLRLRNVEAVTRTPLFQVSMTTCANRSGRRPSSLRQCVARRSRVLNLIRADYTFLNERLAKHPEFNVYGSRFRRVTLHLKVIAAACCGGSVLSVTSYATRTSPVLRGVFVLKNVSARRRLLHLPNVPALDEAPWLNLPMRERMAAHRR